MGLSPSPLLTIIAYFAFAIVCFTIPMLTSSGWAEVLHVRELAIGAAAINTISQIGAFLAPYGWGAAKDATGSFQPVLIGFSFATLVMSALAKSVQEVPLNIQEMSMFALVAMGFIK